MISKTTLASKGTKRNDIIFYAVLLFGMRIIMKAMVNTIKPSRTTIAGPLDMLR